MHVASAANYPALVTKINDGMVSSCPLAMCRAFGFLSLQSIPGFAPHRKMKHGACTAACKCCLGKTV